MDHPVGPIVVSRNVSALKYKYEEGMRKAPELKDVPLDPYFFQRRDNEEWEYGHVADYVVEIDPLFGFFSDDGVEDYRNRAIMAIHTAVEGPGRSPFAVIHLDVPVTFDSETLPRCCTRVIEPPRHGR